MPDDTVLGEDPRVDSRNGEYVIVHPPYPSWPQERWDDYQRRLGSAWEASSDAPR